MVLFGCDVGERRWVRGDRLGLRRPHQHRGRHAGHGTTFAALNADITSVDGASSGDFTIDLGANITETGQLDAINLRPGVTLTINGQSHMLDGAYIYQGLFVYSGDVTVENIQIEHAVANGGGVGLTATGDSNNSAGGQGSIVGAAGGASAIFGGGSGGGAGGDASYHHSNLLGL